jgi:hypothetical protein
LFFRLVNHASTQSILDGRAGTERFQLSNQASAIIRIHAVVLKNGVERQQWRVSNEIGRSGDNVEKSSTPEGASCRAENHHGEPNGRKTYTYVRKGPERYFHSETVTKFIDAQPMPNLVICVQQAPSDWLYGKKALILPAGAI